jgi:hypothetical protein
MDPVTFGTAAQAPFPPDSAVQALVRQMVLSDRAERHLMADLRDHLQEETTADNME